MDTSFWKSLLPVRKLLEEKDHLMSLITYPVSKASQLETTHVQWVPSTVHMLHCIEKKFPSQLNGPGLQRQITFLFFSNKYHLRRKQSINKHLTMPQVATSENVNHLLPGWNMLSSWATDVTKSWKRTNGYTIIPHLANRDWQPHHQGDRRKIKHDTKFHIKRCLVFCMPFTPCLDHRLLFMSFEIPRAML